MEIKFSKADLSKNGVLVFPVAKDLKLSKKLEDIDNLTGGAIKKAIKSGEFSGKKGKFISILGNIDSYDRIILIGTGEDKDLDSEIKIQNFGGSLYGCIEHFKVKKTVFVLEGGIGGFAEDFLAANIAYGIKLKSYHFHKYFTKKQDDKKPVFESIKFSLNASKEAETKYEKLDAIAEGVFHTRDLVSEPSNVVHPESYAEICKDLKSVGVKVEALGEKDLRKLGCESLLAVGQGSAKESHMVIMQWDGLPKSSKEKPIAFVGKGVTFDTGGISLKPSAGMEDMKYDMAGSATVVGLMKALALRKAKVRVVGVVGLVENMPSDNAQRPGDVIGSMSGQTIEVLNTDAEGRLVLADALWYTQDRFNPKFMINLATLTGAIVVALGSLNAGLFSNDDALSEKILEAGKKTEETLWRFPISPIGEGYDKQIDSKIADMQNMGNVKGAGSITAGQFLQRFVNGTPWAHLDIAGMAWNSKSKPLGKEGASGYGVRLLDRLVADHYEV